MAENKSRKLNKLFKRLMSVCICLALTFLVSACGKDAGEQKNTDTEARNTEEELMTEGNTPKTDEDIQTVGKVKIDRTKENIIEEMILEYGFNTENSEDSVREFLAELKSVDVEEAEKWQQIMDLWKYDNEELVVNYEVLPDGLENKAGLITGQPAEVKQDNTKNETVDDAAGNDRLCLVVLGFQLNPDGSMKEELLERLKVTLASAEKYPDSYVLCTGGGTASKNSEATEADRMASWLIDNGLSEDRIIIENKSKTTGQNAVFSHKILKEQYPNVKKVAIISSDYHIPWGTILFETEFMIMAGEGENEIQVISNAACEIESHADYPFYYQAAGILEIIGYTETAAKAYRGQYK